MNTPACAAPLVPLGAPDLPVIVISLVFARGLGCSRTRCAQRAEAFFMAGRETNAGIAAFVAREIAFGQPVPRLP